MLPLQLTNQFDPHELSKELDHQHPKQNATKLIQTSQSNIILLLIILLFHNVTSIFFKWNLVPTSILAQVRL